MIIRLIFHLQELVSRHRIFIFYKIVSANSGELNSPKKVIENEIWIFYWRYFLHINLVFTIDERSQLFYFFAIIKTHAWESIILFHPNLCLYKLIFISWLFEELRLFENNLHRIQILLSNYVTNGLVSSLWTCANRMEWCLDWTLVALRLMITLWNSEWVATFPCASIHHQ